MIDFDVLRKYGTTNERLRAIFTAAPDPAAVPGPETDRISADMKIREAFEAEICSRLSEGVTNCCRNYALYAAVDLAWDAAPINKSTVPLILYAQGRIDASACATQLAALKCGDAYVRKNANGAAEIDLPKFINVEANLVRSFVSRRWSAQCNKYNNLWPYYKYESRSTGLVGKMRADLMSQRADIMADQFGYRHHDTQVYRDTLLYAHCVDFLRAAWESDSQWHRKEVSAEFSGPVGDMMVEERIEREGVCFLNPHPSRVFWDNASPLASINSDSGCEYIGFWDVCRYRDIKTNPLYWNRDRISYGEPASQIWANYSAYFNQYYTTISPPPSGSSLGLGAASDLAAPNDRKNNIGIYGDSTLDSAVFKAEYFRKLVPAAHGLGTYPGAIWVRFVVASDDTVIFAEIMPSTPAAYCGHNENDSRHVSLSFAHEIMPYQDQMNNLLNAMLLLTQQATLVFIGINTDVVKDKKNIEYIRGRLMGENYAGKPIVTEFSGGENLENRIKQTDAISVSQANVNAQSFTAIFRAMAELVALVEKLSAMSPAEMGQPAPREISATEVNSISTTTSSISTSISDSIDEFHAAKKRIIYESVVALQKGEVRLPVISRYSAKTIEESGFKADEGENEVRGGRAAQRRTVTGSVRHLRHDYIFTTRDGAERPINTQAASVLVQMLAQILPVPSVLQAMGKEKLFEMVNDIARLSGAFDLNLELKEGEDESLGQDPMAALAEQFEQLKKIIGELAESVANNTQNISAQEQQNVKQDEALKLVAELSEHIKEMDAKQRAAAEPPKFPIPYKEAPADVQRQMEAASGLSPSTIPPTEQPITT